MQKAENHNVVNKFSIFRQASIEIPVKTYLYGDLGPRLSASISTPRSQKTFRSSHRPHQKLIFLQNSLDFHLTFQIVNTLPIAKLPHESFINH